MKPTLTLLAALLLAPLASLNANDAASTLFYQPSLLADRGQRFSAWSHSIAVRDGRLFNAVSVQRFGSDGRHAGPLGLAIAELDDLYVQAYVTGPTSGRMGLLAKSGPVEFTDLRCWAMTPEGIDQ